MILITEGKMKNGKCVLYARFSPRPNAAECESCEIQLEELARYATKEGFEIVGQYKDEALSGGDSWESRPGMFDAAAACKRGYTLFVRSYDRLFRDVERALVFRSMIEAKGVRVVSITETSANGDSPDSKLIRNILLSIAEYHREMIRARTKAKMIEHQRNGRRMSRADKPPWGMRTDPEDPSRLIPHKEEQDAIEIIIKRRKRGDSYSSIARLLEDLGVDRRGKRSWTHTQVSRILKRAGVD